MTVGLNPYPDTKYSGVEWLGGVPAHWPCLKLTQVARQETGHTPSRKVESYWRPEECVIPWVSLADVWQLREGRIYIEDTKEKVSEAGLANSSARVLPRNTVILSRTASVGFPAILGGPMATTQDFAAWICGSSIQPKYLFYVLLSMKPELHRKMIGATHQTIYMPDIRAFRAPVPPVGEQTAIAHFLDHIDSRIQRYIRAKEKLIALLEEHKQALIHQAVTGQIDVRTGEAYPEYKESGVEWIERVPEHWEVAALRHRYAQSLGKMLDSKRITGRYLTRYLRNIDVQWDNINVSGLPLMDIEPAEFDRYTVLPGDILVCEGGEVGRAAIWSGDLAVCAFQKALHRLRPCVKDQEVPRFFVYALKAAVALGAFSDGHETTIAHLTGEKLRSHRFVFPSFLEQLAIVRFLDGETEKIDLATMAAHRSIALLSQYRARLIADVVTGKIDVRQTAANLPGGDPLNAG